ncbi:retrovirus-related pol polyprotein from transposon TNT 1-94 [Tanacetum coccineum]
MKDLFMMGNIYRETLAEGTEGALHLGPERARVYSDLSPEDKEIYNADIRATNILLQGTSSNPRNQATVQDDKGAQSRVRNANLGQARQVKCYNCNGIGHIARIFTQPKRPQNFEYFKDKMLLMQAQENEVALDEEQLLFITGGQDNAIDEDVDEQPVQDLALNMDNVFLVDDCDSFDSDVDEAPTTQTMFMANLSSANPVYDEVGSSYDSDILSEVHDYYHYQDVICEHHEEYEMHDDYVKDNAVPVVQSNVSSIPNDAYMMIFNDIFNDMHEPHAQSVSNTPQNTVVDNSLTIDEQLRIVITYRNIKEENLKKELYSVKMQLASTINHNKSMVEEVTSLKKDFKQKENKYLEEFLDMKALKEKVEDKLYKQDQSLQTVHMLCKPKPYYNEQNKVAIGYKNPLCLTHAKQVQPALYNGYEIIKNNHVPALVHNTEDTLEIAENTRRKMNDKMKDPECVTHKVKIAPPDCSKENYLATFTPQKQLTPEQIFWSQDLIKMKEGYGLYHVYLLYILV